LRSWALFGHSGPMCLMQLAHAGTACGTVRATVGAARLAVLLADVYAPAAEASLTVTK